MHQGTRAPVHQSISAQGTRAPGHQSTRYDMKEGEIFAPFYKGGPFPSPPIYKDGGAPIQRMGRGIMFSPPKGRLP
ncbi:hypothetical protein B9J78_02350 [bacterium Unc6]|nr:hypothetical protein [bacterium Unc6]